MGTTGTSVLVDLVAVMEERLEAGVAGATGLAGVAEGTSLTVSELAWPSVETVDCKELALKSQIRERVTLATP